MTNRPLLTSVAQLTEPKREPERVPFGDYDLLVWPLSGHDIKKWEKGHSTFRNGKVVKVHADTATQRLLALALRDEHDRPQFSPADIDEMMRQNNADIARIENVARRLSCLDDDEDADADDLESSPVRPPGNGSTPRTPSSIDWRPTSATPVTTS